MLTDRRALVRRLLGGGAALALGAGTAAASPRRKAPESTHDVSGAPASGLAPDVDRDQSAALQEAIDRAAITGAELVLPPGRYKVVGVKLRAGSRLSGAGERTIIEASGAGPALVGEGAHGLRLERLVVAGTGPAAGGGAPSLVTLGRSRDVRLADVGLVNAAGTALVLTQCAGRIDGCRIAGAGAAGLLALDSRGLEIVGNAVTDCSDNGILVWRSHKGEDGTLVAQNRIERIAARSGGSGQNGNGINVFRAGAVRVTDNRITDCAYSAVRANAASNVLIGGNQALRSGEVALYVEFGFEGAVLTGNLVDGAAAGIAVTNFNEGGRLAVVQGNLVRNLHRREHEPVDKRGEGISVEADAAVTGNTIEGAPTAGIVIGWGPHMRDVAATGNVIRGARLGIAITADPAAGACLVAQNLITGARDGAIRMMDHGRPMGPDLAKAAPAGGRITVFGNAVGGAAG